MKSATQRFLFLGSYVLSIFLLLGFLAPGLQADEGVWSLFGLSFAITTIVALVVACTLPLSYCTILKAIGLAGMGGVLVFVLGRVIG